MVVGTLVLLLQAGGQCLEDLCELTREAARMVVLGQEALPDRDSPMEAHPGRRAPDAPGDGF